MFGRIKRGRDKARREKARRVVTRGMFTRKITGSVHGCLPPRCRSTSFRIIRGGGGGKVRLVKMRMGLPREGTDPVVCVRRFFSRVQRKRPIRHMVGEVTDYVRGSDQTPFVGDKVSLAGCSSLGRRLTVGLIGARTGQGVLRRVPRRGVRSLSTVYCISFPMSSERKGTAVRVEGRCLDV